MPSERDKATSTEDSKAMRIQFTLSSAFQIIAVAAFTLALVVKAGPVPVYIAEACVLVLALMTMLGVRQIAGFIIPRPTANEWLTIMIVLLVIHCMQLPAFVR